MSFPLFFIFQVEHDLKEPVANCRANYEAIKQNGTWSLVGSTTSLNFFLIDPTSGVVYATRDLDYEERSSHDLVIQYRVSPSESELFAPLVAITHLNVIVEDSNDCAPFFQTPLESDIFLIEIKIRLKNLK